MPREMPLGDPTNLETEWVRVPVEHRCQYCEELFPTAAARNRHEDTVCEPVDLGDDREAEAAEAEWDLRDE